MPDALTPAFRRVSGLAYNGGKLSLAGWKHPVVVDLNGLSIPTEVPLLANHENRTASRLGLMRATVAGGPVLSLLIDGTIVSTSGTAEGVLEQARAGASWQLSIGVDALEKRLIDAGSETVNGQEHTAPFFHVTKSVLMEVSVVPVGADTSTRLSIAAMFVVSDGQTVDGNPPVATPTVKDETRMEILKFLKTLGKKNDETDDGAVSRMERLVAAFGEGQGEFIAAAFKAGHDVAGAITEMRAQHVAALEAKQKDVERLNAESVALTSKVSDLNAELAAVKDAEGKAQETIKAQATKIADLEKRPPVTVNGSPDSAPDTKEIEANIRAGYQAGLARR